MTTFVENVEIVNFVIIVSAYDGKITVIENIWIVRSVKIVHGLRFSLVFFLL